MVIGKKLNRSKHILYRENQSGERRGGERPNLKTFDSWEEGDTRIPPLGKLSPNSLLSAEPYLSMRFLNR